MGKIDLQQTTAKHNKSWTVNIHFGVYCTSTGHYGTVTDSWKLITATSLSVATGDTVARGDQSHMGLTWARYVKLWVCMRRECRERFPRKRG